MRPAPRAPAARRTMRAVAAVAGRARRARRPPRRRGAVDASSGRRRGSGTRLRRRSTPARRAEEAHSAVAEQRRLVRERRRRARGAAREEARGHAGRQRRAAARRRRGGAAAVAARRAALSAGAGAARRSAPDLRRASAGRARYDIAQRVWNTTGPVLVHVVHQELRACRAPTAWRPSARGRTPPPAGAPSRPSRSRALVALGLQPADEPRAGVGERLVVEVDGVLRREHDAEAGGTRLLEQRQQRPLRRRVGDRRRGSRRPRPCRAARAGSSCRTARAPTPRPLQEQRHEEHALACRRGARWRRSRCAACPPASTAGG